MQRRETRVSIRGCSVRLMTTNMALIAAVETTANHIPKKNTHTHTASWSSSQQQLLQQQMQQVLDMIVMHESGGGE